MYVPAEAVYSEMIADGEEKALADACIAMRVYPVSPRLLHAFLSTIAMAGFGGMAPWFPGATRSCMS